MANPSGVIKPSLKGFSFIDWEGLSKDEYEKLNKIINNPETCAGVKLPFHVDRSSYGNEPGHHATSSLKKPEYAAPAKALDETSRSSINNRTPVFQAHIPPPPHQAPLPSAAPPVVYPVPVHHWASPAPPPVPPGPSHFPLTMQGGYIIPNQPPPPLVTNADAATIAFVAAMSTGQPVYAIPGVPLHNHYPGGSTGFTHVEPLDLTVPVVAQQPVTVHHFVQPEQVVFTPAHPLQTSVSHNQSQAIPPGTNSIHSTSLDSSHNFTHVPYDHTSSRGIHSNSHVVHIPEEVNPLSSSSPAATVKPLEQSDSEQLLASKQPPKSHSNSYVTSGKTILESSLSPNVEFVGPVVFESGSSNTSVGKLAINGNVADLKEREFSPVVKDLASVNISDKAEASPASLAGLSVNSGSTHGDSNFSKEAKTREVSLSEHSSQSDSTKKLSPTESKENDAKELSITTSLPEASPQPQAPKMWSSLFGKSKSSNPVSPTSPGSTPVALVPAPVPLSAPLEEVKSIRYWQEKEKAEAKHSSATPQKVVPVHIQNDPIAPQILGVLSSLPIVHTPLVIQPRGLVNGSNVCFMNATLQVLMGCPPFIHLFRAFKNLPPRQHGGSCTPILDSLVEFVNSFQNGQRVKSQGSRNKKGAHSDINVGQPFSPTSLLIVAQDILGLRIGIQHDAEEFLSKILMICHEELENILKLNQQYALNNNNGEVAKNNGHVNDSLLEEEEDESWQKVGPKNHHVETNVNDCGQTPLSGIFCGLSRSCLTRETGKNSDTLDSFFTLKLDIQGENVHSVADALQRLNVSETLHDIDGGKFQGQRRMFFDVLPPVLIMHLKLFQYSDGNGKKIQKKVDFDVDLTIPKETLSRVGKNKYMSPKSRSYKLFGVVNHHGLKMTDGHYTSDVFLPIASGWLRFDDSEVFAIHEKQVLQHSDRHMPYLLFYRRMDVS